MHVRLCHHEDASQIPECMNISFLLAEQGANTRRIISESHHSEIHVIILYGLIPSTYPQNLCCVHHFRLCKRLYWWWIMLHAVWHSYDCFRNSDDSSTTLQVKESKQLSHSADAECSTYQLPSCHGSTKQSVLDIKHWSYSYSNIITFSLIDYNSIRHYLSYAVQKIQAMLAQIPHAQ